MRRVFWLVLRIEGPGDADALSVGLLSNVCTRDTLRHLLMVVFRLVKRSVGT